MHTGSSSHIHVHPASYRGEADWSSNDHDTVQESLEELEELVLTTRRPLHLDFHPPYLSSLPRHFHSVIEALEEISHGPVHLYVPGPKAYSHCARYLPAALTPRHRMHIGQIRLSITVGDIARAHAQVLVNASNRKLELGGGVSGSLRTRFGDELQHMMRHRADRELEDGELVVTSHPIRSGVEAIYHVASAAGDDVTIRRAIENVLKTARAQNHAHVIMPALGCGTGGMTIAEFSGIMLDCLARTHSELELELWLWTLDDFEACLLALE